MTLPVAPFASKTSKAGGGDFAIDSGERPVRMMAAREPERAARPQIDLAGRELLARRIPP
jgi:hypothetical protein